MLLFRYLGIFSRVSEEEKINHLLKHGKGKKILKNGFLDGDYL